QLAHRLGRAGDLEQPPGGRQGDLVAGADGDDAGGEQLEDRVVPSGGQLEQGGLGVRPDRLAHPGEDGVDLERLLRGQDRLPHPLTTKAQRTQRLHKEDQSRVPLVLGRCLQILYWSSLCNLGVLCAFVVNGFAQRRAMTWLLSRSKPPTVTR